MRNKSEKNQIQGMTNGAESKKKNAKLFFDGIPFLVDVICTISSLIQTKKKQHQFIHLNFNLYLVEIEYEFYLQYESNFN